MRVSVDDTKCCGAGQCVLLVPQVFDQREEDGVVRLLDPSPPPELAGAVQEAEEMCPTGTISVSDAP